MAKYIDADKLRKELEHRVKILTNVYAEQLEKGDDEMMNYYHGKVVALEELRSFLDTLQKQLLPGVEEKGIPGKDFIPVEWVEACERYSKWEIVKKVKEVDLEKEMDKYYDSPQWEGEDVSWMTYVRIATYFFELGKNSKI